MPKLPPPKNRQSSHKSIAKRATLIRERQRESDAIDCSTASQMAQNFETVQRPEKLEYGNATGCQRSAVVQSFQRYAWHRQQRPVANRAPNLLEHDNQPSTEWDSLYRNNPRSECAEIRHRDDGNIVGKSHRISLAESIKRRSYQSQSGAKQQGCVRVVHTRCTL
jgi:hypothetical protein